MTLRSTLWLYQTLSQSNRKSCQKPQKCHSRYQRTDTRSEKMTLHNVEQYLICTMKPFHFPVLTTFLYFSFLCSIFFFNFLYVAKNDGFWKATSLTDVGCITIYYIHSLFCEPTYVKLLIYIWGRITETEVTAAYKDEKKEVELTLFFLFIYRYGSLCQDYLYVDWTNRYEGEAFKVL